MRSQGTASRKPQARRQASVLRKNMTYPEISRAYPNTHTIGFIFIRFCLLCISWSTTYDILILAPDFHYLRQWIIGKVCKGMQRSYFHLSLGKLRASHTSTWASSESATYCDGQQSAWASAWHRPMAGQLYMAVQWWLSLHKCQEKKHPAEM